jgi:REP element-mobilizing transposase RayT
MPFFSRRSLNNARPEWVDENDPLFITICHKSRGVRHFDNPEAWSALIASANCLRQRGQWTPIVLLAMPDHLHGIVRIPRGITTVLGEFKRDFSYRVPTSWQKGSFDHRLRSYGHSLEKLDYILANPVRAGFVLEAERWPYVHWWDVRGYKRAI